MIQNLTKTKSPNLKSNVFDKMLSDEMFSIKQHFYEKDMTYSSSVYISTQSNIPTPTLEVKQKWPLGEFMSKLNKIEEIKQYADESDSFNEVINKTILNDSTSLESNVPEVINEEPIISIGQQNKPKNKIIDLRSLPESTLNPIYYSKVCTCLKSNEMTTCTHRCTGSNSYHKCTRNPCNSVPTPIMRPSHQCTHTVSKACPKCTSYTQYFSTTLIPFTMGVYPAVNYYVPVQSNIPYKNPYYHPDILNELKIPVKLKRRKTTRHHRTNEGLYYDSNDSRESQYDEYLENDKQYKPRLKQPTARDDEDEGDFVPFEYNDITVKEDKLKKKIPINAGVYDANQNKFVKDIINDLKTYYGETVIKDCYCSSSTKIIFSRCSLMCMATFYVFAMHLISRF